MPELKVLFLVLPTFQAQATILRYLMTMTIPIAMTTAGSIPNIYDDDFGRSDIYPIEKHFIEAEEKLRIPRLFLLLLQVFLVFTLSMYRYIQP
jgi:hypothetical protein